MAKITVNEDCGNAPKKLFLKDFIVATVNNDRLFLAAGTTDDVRWTQIGAAEITGKPAVLAAFRRSRSAGVAELIIHTIVTHGYHGATNGELKFRNGTTLAFCDVYEFRASTNYAPIKAITTYGIPLG